jgi:cysteinyl-tRNA synthetase
MFLDLEEKIVPDEVLELVEARKKAKEDKDWEKADILRAKIKEMGFELQDSKGDYIVKKISV